MFENQYEGQKAPQVQFAVCFFLDKKEQNHATYSAVDVVDTVLV